MNARRLLIVLGIVVVGSATVYLLQPGDAPAVDFSDSLTGPTSEQFDIPFDKYTLTPEGLARHHSASGRGNGNDRPVVRTISDAYLTRDFVFEVDLTFPADVEDIAFVGLGAGASALPYQEPTGVFGFRIHHLPGNKRIDFGVVAEPQPGMPASHVFQQAIGTTPSTGDVLSLRIERAGDHLTSSIPGQAGSELKVRISAYPAVLKRGFLYLSNTAEGTVFSNVKVRPRT